DLARITAVQLLLVLTSLLMLYPIVAMLLSAFKPTGEIYATPFALPAEWRLDNFAEIWTGTSFQRYMANSVIVTVASTASILALGTMAAYALARSSLPANPPR